VYGTVARSRRRSGPAAFLIGRRRLVTLCVGLAALEAGILELLHAGWAAGMAPQVVAPAPFGVFHDLRWLVVYHRSLPAFCVELVALLLFRSALDTLLVREAWPADQPRPPFLRAWSRTLLFTIVAAILLAPWVVLLFGLAVVSLSWLFFSAIPPMLAVALLTNGGAVSTDWWRRTVPLRAVGWIALTFVAMSACGGLVSHDRGGWAVPVAAAGGLFNAWAWNGVVGAMTSERRSRRFAPVAPAALVFLLAVVAGGTEIGFAVTTARAHDQRVRAREAAGAPRPDAGTPVLVASGFGTRWDGTSGPWLAGPFDEERFSYKGLDGTGRPLAYDPSDTSASLTTLDAEMATQVNALALRDHRKVSIVAASEGTLVAETYLARNRSAPVDQVVLLSPLVTPGRVYYPPPGTDGWGVVGREGLAALSGALGGLSPLHVSPGTPLFRSIETDAPVIQSLLACPPSGVHLAAVEPVADAVASPDDPDPEVPTVVVPAFHSGTLGDPNADVAVTDILENKPLPGSGGWSTFEHVLRPVSAVWGVPQLAASVNPAWSSRSGSCGRR
jgi:hypothetical protein